MTRRSRIAMWGGIALFVLIASAAGGIAWIVKVRRDVAPPAPALYVQARFREVRDSPGHTAHLGLPDVSCESCHIEVDGGLSRPTALVCGECHEEIPPAIHPQAQAGAVGAEGASWDHPPSCQGCHRFTDYRDYGPNECMRCHLLPHGATPAIVRHAETDCTLCHRPHVEPSLLSASCLDCHQRHPTDHGDVESPAGCITCHRAHETAQMALSRCNECHAQRGVRR